MWVVCDFSSGPTVLLRKGKSLLLGCESMLSKERVLQSGDRIASARCQHSRCSAQSPELGPSAVPLLEDLCFSSRGPELPALASP